MTSRHPAIVNCSYLNDERLTSALGSTVYSMAYDALGRCVKRTLTGGPTTYYVYDDDKPILEYDSSGSSLGVNVYGKGVDEPSEWGYREMDGQVREGNGRAEREKTSQYAATYRSTYTTAAFNFYEYRARAYNAKLGRFMSEDHKLADTGDYNLFRYCHNDPIDNVDPMGSRTFTFRRRWIGWGSKHLYSRGLRR